jgi:antitoxin HigA-1
MDRIITVLNVPEVQIVQTVRRNCPGKTLKLGKRSVFRGPKVQQFKPFALSEARLERLERLEPNNLKEFIMATQNLTPLHPGRVLLEEFLAPRGISVFHFAKEIDVSSRRVYEIVQGQRAINADIAHRLAHYFGTSERYWLDLQAKYDGKQADKLPTVFPRKRSLRYVG